VAACRSTVPLQVLAPVALDDPAVVVSILNPTGGLAGGDRVVIEVAAGSGAHGCLTTPSATKVYRTRDRPAIQEVGLRLAADATLEYVPDHTIPFAGAAFQQVIRAEVPARARLIVVDAFAAGRVARGEAWRFTSAESALVVSDGSGWLLRDRFVLRGDGGWAGLGLTEACPYFATIAGFGDGSEAVGHAVAAAVGGHRGVTAAGGPLARRGWLVRCLARSAPDLVEALETLWGTARRQMLGLRPLPLRKL
jgi:urease accessory protein